MSDRLEWFSAKKRGYGAGLPIAWQGWALMVGYMVVVLGAGLFLADRSVLGFISVIVPATLLFLFVSAKTTRGGWRWRWDRLD
ncbi:hypothetical protein SH584_08065 [Sphingomonas sp. LY29]|uniref:hypothetical protein n=1 Tax=Sphingomonas sp. LY29 TaxID=3095341 RepID=UPI002D79F94D|nr:hypothetical protein [Sphingomonas sp. LY29]WRP25012.1 hypothetical protein SH584_08065 [Sphingomonas sp. LY29]